MLTFDVFNFFSFASLVVLVVLSWISEWENILPLEFFTRDAITNLLILGTFKIEIINAVVSPCLLHSMPLATKAVSFTFTGSFPHQGRECAVNLYPPKRPLTNRVETAYTGCHSVSSTALATYGAHLPPREDEVGYFPSSRYENPRALLVLSTTL